MYGEGSISEAYTYSDSMELGKENMEGSRPGGYLLMFG